MPSTDNRPFFQQRREGRIARRRDEILAAAARAFAEKGYTRTTMTEIAAAADLAEGTLYNYFPGKRDLWLAVAAETEAPMEAVILAAGQIHDRASLVGVVERALDLSEARLALMRVVLSEAWVDDRLMQESVARRLGRIHRLLAAYIAEQQAAGLIRPADPALTAQLIMGLFAAVILPVLGGASQPQTPAARHTAAEAIVALAFDGLLARPA
jgi:AcrR family transcriptional regulator